LIKSVSKNISYGQAIAEMEGKNAYAYICNKL